MALRRTRLDVVANSTRGLARAEGGNVAMIGGLVLVVVMMIVAMAVDYGRATSAKTTLQAALDAAALAGAKVLQVDGATAATVTTTAEATFNSYLGNLRVDGLTTTNFKAVADFPNDRVIASVDAKVKSLFSGLAGTAPYLSFTPSSTVSYAYEKIELALVVDVTGSMNLVPAGDTKTKIQSLKEAGAIVVNTLMADSPAESAVRIAIAPFSASVNAGGLANLVSNPNTTGCTWGWNWSWSCPDDTCVIERPVNHNDNDPSTDKIPTMPLPAYGNYVCPNAPVVPLQGLSQQQNLINTINAYSASGATAGHIGAAWGWYLLSPNWASVLPAASKPGPTNDKHTHKHVIFMTDGQFNTSYLSGSAATSTQQTDDSYAEFQSFCTKMKAQGKVTIWTIGFDLGGLGTTRPKDELIQCSGADHFFDAPTGDALKAAFSQIVKNMRSMRVAS